MAPAGWMGGVEIGKLALGRDSEAAFAAGAIVPGGIMGIWTRNIYGGMRTAFFLGLWGVAYQYACNNNLTNTVFIDSNNPNIPKGRFETQTAGRPGRSGRRWRGRSSSPCPAPSPVLASI